MKRIYTYGGMPATRNLTVADIKAGKGMRKFVQTTAVNRTEAAAAQNAGIDHLSIVDHDLAEVRAGAPDTFTTAALMASDYETHQDILRAGIRAAAAGADAVYTLRSFKAVELLADEGLAVQGHLGLVPRLSTNIGGLRAYGRTADEAMQLAEDLRRLEDAGAYAVELECVASEVIAELSPRTGLITHSIGSGDAADVIFLFQDDACGDTENAPRHAKAFADMAAARATLEAERMKGLTAYRAAVLDGSYPDAATSIAMKPGEHDKLREALDKRRPFHE
ncbi:3-methyl-2-oxobutanoate hydroxymethyltransferase [Thalassobius sp. I31.1]|uniref:3-methyl-2-oxobutanoate hydroxymethyltransferase n=1 Tax=Thalassobius sp. I31.1 TaxID=2109912 RepID=UPI000D1ACCA0|nr:3-methyl-2-oxobutanoate hydroxymethyltransferase [Thalassobius sp. I31.1]